MNEENDLVMVCGHTFYADPDCENCLGTGIFAEDDNGTATEPCIFCLDDHFFPPVDTKGKA
jgi:hypothetical protein